MSTLLKTFSLFFFHLLTVILIKQVSSADLDVIRYRQEALAQHNIYRAQCNAEALQQNKTLETIAQAHCDSLAARNEFNHSGTVEYGENSYQKIPFDFKNDNGATPVNAWYSERSNYIESKPENGGGLHFTQVVWKSTKYLGVGICSISNGGLLVVANYYPRGNYKDQFAQNVLCKNPA